MSNTRRYILLPPRGTGATWSITPEAAKILELFNAEKTASARAGDLRSALGIKGTLAAKMKVVDSIADQGAKLVEMSPEAMIALRGFVPGLRIVPEVFHRMLRAPRPEVVEPFQATRRAAAAATVTVTVKIGRKASAPPAVGATVVAFTDFAARRGAQGTTDAQGRVTLQFPEGTKIDQLYVYPESGAWSYWKKSTVLKDAATIALKPIELTTPDGVQALMGRGTLQHGMGVTVGVVDTGVGPHQDLPVAGGENTVSGEQPDQWQDSGAGHGTHVAGIVAARGETGGIRGVAPGATIRSYRVFGANSNGASNFAIAKAIARATEQGCDLVNLSLGGGPADEATQAAIADARAAGVLVFAATGNDGRQPVSFPARFGMAVAVSASGRKGTFPADTTEKADIAPPFGSDKKNFIASFSNIGPETDLTGAGVGIVSTYPQSRYAVMSGTSMACPAVCGVAARLLAAHPEILSLPRNQERSDRIAKLVFDAAVNLGFPPEMQGAGLPR